MVSPTENPSDWRLARWMCKISDFYAILLHFKVNIFFTLCFKRSLRSPTHCPPPDCVCLTELWNRVLQLPRVYLVVTGKFLRGPKFPPSSVKLLLCELSFILVSTKATIKNTKQKKDVNSDNFQGSCGEMRWDIHSTLKWRWNTKHSYNFKKGLSPWKDYICFNSNGKRYFKIRSFKFSC